jgi:hypothetical protein
MGEEKGEKILAIGGYWWSEICKARPGEETVEKER